MNPGRKPIAVNIQCAARTRAIWRPEEPMDAGGAQFCPVC